MDGALPPPPPPGLQPGLRAKLYCCLPPKAAGKLSKQRYIFLLFCILKVDDLDVERANEKT